MSLTPISLERSERLTNSNQVQLIRENGKEGSEMGREFRYDLMGLSMKGSGRITELMGKGGSYMLIRMNMKGSGQMIRQMGEESIDIRMELPMMDSGKKIFSMEKGLRNGLMGVYIRVSI